MAVTTTKLPNTAIGIKYTHITDSSSDWTSGSLPNSTYFYDKATNLVYFKNSSGDVVEIFEEGGGGTDANAVHVNVAGEINGIAAKSTPTASDLLIIEDAADSNNKKKIAIGNLPIGGGGSGTKVLVQGQMDTTQSFTSAAERIDYVDSTLDINGEWDNTTHRFTVAASGAGVYQFTNQVFVDNGGGWLQIFCKKNGVSQRISASDFASSWDVPAGTTNIELAVGDYVEFWADSTSSFTVSATWYALNNFQITKLSAVAPAAGTDVNAVHTNIGGEITALTAKATPTTSDVLIIEDVADSNNKKKSTLAGIKNTVAPTLSKTLTLEAPTASDNISIFRTDVAITVQQVISVSTGTTPSTTYQLKHHTDRSNAGNNLTNSSISGNTTTGNIATLSDPTIPADSFIWFETTAASGTDVYLSVNIRYTED